MVERRSGNSRLVYDKASRTIRAEGRDAAAALVESLAEILMLRDVAPFPRVWKGEPRQGTEIDNRGVTWTTFTPVCSEKERQKWRGEAVKFIEQLRAARLQVLHIEGGTK